MLLESPGDKKPHAVDGAAASHRHRSLLTQKLYLLRARPAAVSGLFRSGWKKPKNNGGAGLPVALSGAGADTSGSECSEEEEDEFFEDLRRVRRGQLISRARVDVVPARHRGPSAAAASISRVFGLLAKKGGVFSAALLRKAAGTARVHAAKATAAAESTAGGEEAGDDGGRCRGGGLWERRVLVGRRSKRHEDDDASSELCFLLGEDGGGRRRSTAMDRRDLH